VTAVFTLRESGYPAPGEQVYQHPRFILIRLVE
jgi:hypothetical protein